jgi:hypothetical protein
VYQPVPAKKLPEDAVLYKLIVDEGMTPTEVRDWLKVHKDIDVTAASVSMWRRRAGLPPTMPRRSPWSYLPGTNHSNVQEAQVVRAYFRREAGLPNDPERTRMLESMERRLRDAGLVLWYNTDPEKGPLGWLTARPRPGIDLGIIREPDGKPHPPKWRERQQQEPAATG